MSQQETELDQLVHRLESDHIAFLLIQFVDIHGAAKVKLVPARTLARRRGTGRGFAGGAVWGMGQGPHSHDMFARVDLDTYTPLPYEPGVARFAADLYVDGQPHPYCPRVNLKRSARGSAASSVMFSTSASSPSFSWSSRTPTARSGLGPARSRRPGQALLRLQGDVGRTRLSACAQRRPRTPRLGRLPVRSRRRQRPVRDQFPIRRRVDHRRSLNVLPDDGRPARPAIRRDRDVHGQAVLEPHRLRRPHALSPGRRRHAAGTCFSIEPIRAGWVSRRSLISSSAACSSTPRRSAPSPRRRSTATSGFRWARP